MEYTGKVERFVGIKGIIRPDTWNQSRVDVHFNKAEHTELKVGDKVVYTKDNKNGRSIATTLRKK